MPLLKMSDNPRLGKSEDEMNKEKLMDVIEDTFADLMIYFLLPGGENETNRLILLTDLSEYLKLKEYPYLARRTNRDLEKELASLHPVVVDWLKKSRDYKANGDTTEEE